MMLIFILAIWLPATLVVVQGARFTNPSYSGVTAGDPFIITWEPASAVVTVKLNTGSSTVQRLVNTIVSGATGGSFTWIPPSDAVPGQLYDLEIDEGSSPNYSVQFTIAARVASESTAKSTSIVPIPSSTTAHLGTTTPLPLSTNIPSSSTSTRLSTISSDSPLIAQSPTSSLPTTTTPDSSASTSTDTTSPPDSSSLISTPTSSSVNTIQSSLSNSPSAGAKAGIGIGAVLAACIIISGIWFCFSWKKRRQSRAPGDLEQRESISIEKGHELITTANTHEMEGKITGAAHVTEKEFGAEGAELEARIVSPVSPTAETVDEKAATQATELDAQHTISAVPELDCNDENNKTTEPIPSGFQTNIHQTAAATNVGSSWEHFQPSELDSNAIKSPISELSAPSPIAALPNPVPTRIEHSSAPIMEPVAEILTTSPLASVPAIASTSTIATDNLGEDKLESLQRRMDQVREDKERLEKIQQLKDLEAELQKEILAERKKREGGLAG